MNATARLWLAVLALVLPRVGQSDDIDMFLQAAGGERAVARVVLIVPGLPEDRAEDLVSALAAGLERLAARAEATAQQPQVALIGGQPEPRLLVPFGPLVAVDHRQAIIGQLAGLPPLLADPVSGELPDYPLAAVYREIEDYLLGRAEYSANTLPVGANERCVPLHLAHLVAGPTVATLPGLELPAGVSVVRAFFLALKTMPELDLLARQGGTLAALDLFQPDLLPAALETVFAHWREAKSVVAGVSRVVDQRDRGHWLEPVFMALYRPGVTPRWSGNLKKLQLPPDGSGALVDALGAGALSPATGRLLPEVLSFWTDPGERDVQAFNPARGEVRGRDGDSVERGGAGQRIPGFPADRPPLANADPGARQLFTEDPDNPGGMLPLDAGAAIPALSPFLDPGDVLDDADERRLLAWIRGLDSYDEDGDGQRQDARPWLLGDVIHSRPLVVNYGAREGSGYSAANPDIRVYFGSNDGLLRGVVNTYPDGRQSGTEAFAFLPLELLDLQASLAGNRVSDGPPHPYGLDGEPLAWIKDLDHDGNIEPSAGDGVYLYIGQRRGGSTLYALDVSDPDSPRLMWKLDAGTPGFEQLGLGFSTPRLARLDIGAGQPVMTLLFAGGYHGGWRDGQPLGKDAGRGADPVGNAIYVVDAQSGTLLWRAVGPSDRPISTGAWRTLPVAAMIHSIPSPLTPADGDGDGVVDRAYVGDSGGRLWRLELTQAAWLSEGELPATQHWRMALLGDFGGAGGEDRRFFHAPDFVAARDDSGAYGGVLLASGDRAHPLEREVQNYLYLVKDRVPVTGINGTVPVPETLDQASLPDVTALCATDSDLPCQPPDLAMGWRLRLEGEGEKAWSSVLTVSGVAGFNTYRPAPLAGESCASPEGAGRSYMVYLADGRSATSAIHNINLPDIGTRYIEATEGPPAAQHPTERGLLLPGRGAGGKTEVELPGPVLWLESWREIGVDTL